MTHDKAIKCVRDKIDVLDSKLLTLINQRIELAKEIGDLKKIAGHDTVIYRPEREAQVIRRLNGENKGQLSSTQVNAVFREIMSICRNAELPLRIAVLGPEGTFTQIAALQQFGSSIQSVLLPEIDQIFAAVEHGDAHYGVVPIENSSEGIISQTADCLVSSSLNIAGEIHLPIHQTLLSAATKISDIQTVFSHAQSLSQCRKWLFSHLPNVKIKSVSSNAEAALLAQSTPNSAAIASEIAAVQYDLNILAKNIEDHHHNTTRFLVLAHEKIAPSGDDKTSLVMSCKNEPGSLFRLLEPLHNYGISMLKIESRPSKIKHWEYVFFIDIQGHAEDSDVRSALKEVEMSAEYFRVLGAYPCAQDFLG